VKKAIIFLLPLVLLGVGGFLVFTGKVKIPGVNLGPKQKANDLYAADKANSLYTADKDGKAPTGAKDGKSTAVAKNEPPKKETPKKDDKKTPPKVVVDAFENKPEVGQKKLAKLWNEMEPTTLSGITKDWNEKDLAGILVRMDTAKVAEFLSSLDPKRASKLSRELQKQASIVPRETGS